MTTPPPGSPPPPAPPQPPQAEQPALFRVSVAVLWSAIATVAAAFVGVAKYSYDLGEKSAEMSGKAKILELTSSVSDSERKRAAMEQELHVAQAENGKLAQEQKKLIETIGSRNALIEQLAAQVGATNNCAFIQQQIVALERERNGIGHVNVFDRTNVRKEDEESRRQEIDRKIADYVKQLGNCR